MNVKSIRGNSGQSFNGIIKVKNMGYETLLLLRNYLSTAEERGKLGSKGFDYFCYGGKVVKKNGSAEYLSNTTVLFFGKDVKKAKAWRIKNPFRVKNKEGIYIDNPKFFDKLKAHCESITRKSPVYDTHEVVSYNEKTDIAQTSLDKLMTAVVLDKLNLTSGKIKP
jgi:dienelactone hydrolase